MSAAAVTPDFFQALDVEGVEAAQVALHRVLLHLLTQRRQLLLRQLPRPLVLDGLAIRKDAWADLEQLMDRGCPGHIVWCMLQHAASMNNDAYRVRQDGLGRGRANAEDVLEGELNALLVGDVHSRHTRCLYPERAALTHHLRRKIGDRYAMR